MYEAEVRVPDAFAKSYADVPYLDRMPDGLTAAIYLYEPRTNELVSVLVLAYATDHWEAVALDRNGYRLEAQNPSLCLRCHADAPSQTLFGPPANKRGIIAAPGALKQRVDEPRACPCKASEASPKTEKSPR